MTKQERVHNESRDDAFPDLESLERGPFVDDLSRGVAELIEGGAKLVQDSQSRWVVVLSDQQRAQLERAHVTQPKIDQLLESTEIGQRIAAQVLQLDSLNKRILNRIQLGPEDTGEWSFVNVGGKTFEELYRDYFEDHGYGEQDASTIDWQKLDQKDKRYADFIKREVIKEGKTTLDALTVSLLERPDLEIGSRVTVSRSHTDAQGQPVKESWLITDITLAGMIRVRPEPKSTAYKDLSIENIEKLNKANNYSQARLARGLGGPLRGEEDVEQSGSLRETPHQVGHEALAVVGIEEPTGSVELDQSDEDRIIAEYDDLVKNLSENDKVALWWYVAEPYPPKRNLEKMSYGLRQNRQLITKAQEVYGRLKKIRETNRE